MSMSLAGRRLFGRLVPAVLLLVASCDTPESEIFTPEPGGPVDVGNGVFRVTFSDGPDFARGFTAGGDTIIYRSRGLEGFGDDWVILAVPLEGGAVSEEAAVYRRALKDPVGNLAYGQNSRILVTWKPPTPGVTSCPGPCVQLPVFTLSFTRLELTDGPPLSKLVRRTVGVDASFPDSSVDFVVEFVPALQELARSGGDPFGPALIPGTSDAVISDGVSLFRIDLADSTVPPIQLAPGAFPAVSPGGRVVAASVPASVGFGVDSVCTVVAGLGACRQRTVIPAFSTWNTVIIDLETLAGSTLLGEGVEPQFDPAGARVLVRRNSGLVWIDLLDSRETPLPGTEGATGPVISPDGKWVAFTSSRFGSPDVFLVRAGT